MKLLNKATLMSKSSGKVVLIFGATGKAGTHAVQSALDANDDVHVFVRNPGKLAAAIKAKVHVIPGNLADPASVAAAVTAVSPDAIIICSGHAPKDDVSPLNAIAVPAIVKALAETHRLQDCFVVYLSGMFSDLAADPLPWYSRILRALIVPMVGIKAMVSDNREVTEYLTTGAGQKSGVQFTIVRMGYPKEAGSQGTIVPVKFNPTGAVTFSDMGLFLVRLAHGMHREVALGKAIKPFYARS
jgi:NAD(P)-dependent dehydrogenase (short-subunit alcohol dehydrogenase family)